jgi:tight adherence protein C
MLALAVVLVAGGLFALVVGIAAMRTTYAGQPAVAHTALGPDDTEIVDDPIAHASFVYRASEPLLAAAARLGAGLSPRARRDLLARRIIYAGREGSLTVEQLIGAKVVGGIFGVLIGTVVHVGVGWYLWSLLWGAVLFFAPDMWIDSLARSRQQQIGRALPEALDLLAITVEAGLGLEQALEVVSENMPGPLGEEITRLLREIEIGVTRREALSALRDRTDVPELSAFVVALVQADALGVAIADVLRVQAAQVRLRRKQHAREQAAKTPVKILFPVIFGVLPSLFVVVIGPAAITIVQNLSNH